MDLKNIPKEYRPVPFWSWNDELEPEETARQINIMDKAGLGGFFMHARGGLKTEYLSEKWFDNVQTAIDTAKECGMKPWAYDENGWPSGFGSGVVNGLGIEYQQKYLRISDSEPAENVICKSGNHWFYYDVNPFYVDTLDKKVIAKFIEVAYEPYYERYKDNFEGFFTDEPQISRNGIPWSFVYKEEYAARYGEDINEHLEELFLEIGDYKNTRVKFWKMVTELFSEAFMKQIYDWCEAHGLKVTGHLVLEETLECQLITNGACMPHYEYFHIPGMDWLGREIRNCLTPLQVSSVAEQLGKDMVLAETFALCGHNVSFAELKGIYEWQMVHGINLLCQHLEGYTLRGIRKRDYPPAMYYQQPWWSEYDKLNDAFSREGMILAKGEKKAEVLLLHPQVTAWACQNAGDNGNMSKINAAFLDDIKALEGKHIRFHLGDEIIMERHARVENGKLIIGKQAYTTILNTRCEIMLDNTKRLLDEFEKSGGTILTATDAIEANDIIDNPEITYTERVYEGQRIHFFVNTSPDRKTAKIKATGKKLDIYTGDFEEFSGNYEFEPWGSLMLFEDSKVSAEPMAEPSLIKPSGVFRLAEPVMNSLTLDKCDYYFDGVLQEKNGYVLNIVERANELERAVNIKQDYHISVLSVPSKLEMACETPELFKISINGTEIDKKVTGTFVDSSFKKLDIAKHIKEGENTITFELDFVQSDEFYESLRKSYKFESEKNKLAYDVEIEAIYLVGDFSVRTDGAWEQLDKKAVRYSGEFALDKPKAEIDIKNIEQQGYPFLCGEMALVGEIDINGENPVLELNMDGINAVKVEINGVERTMLTDNRMSLLPFGVTGRQEIKMTLINNLRNLLGPHHLKCGESVCVGPNAFYKEPCVWNGDPAKDWNEDYCFVEINL